MRKTSFFVLVAATAVAVAAAGRAVVRDFQHTDAMPLAHRAFPDLAARLGDLAWLRLVHGGDTLDFGLIGGVWTVVEKDNYPAAQDRVDRLLHGLARLVLVAPKTRRPALYARLGLGDPARSGATLVSAQDRTGATVAALVVGKVHADPMSGLEDGVYVRRPGDDQTWLARGRLPLAETAIDWLDRRILDIAPMRIAAVTLTAADGAVLRLRRDAPDTPFALVDPPAGIARADPAALARPAGLVTQLDLDDVKPAALLPVPPGGVTTAVFTTFDGLTLRLRLFRTAGRDWLAIDATGAGTAAAEAAALGQKLAPWVYAVPEERARLLRARLADFAAKGS